MHGLENLVAFEWKEDDLLGLDTPFIVSKGVTKRSFFPSYLCVILMKHQGILFAILIFTPYFISAN